MFIQGALTLLQGSIHCLPGSTHTRLGHLHSLSFQLGRDIPEGLLRDIRSQKAEHLIDCKYGLQSKVRQLQEECSFQDISDTWFCTG